MTPTQAADHFREDMSKVILKLFGRAENAGVTESLMMRLVALESIALSAFMHNGARDDFLQMARDAFALSRTGEMEQ